MEHALAELPLAIFTTLTPISAGTFVALAIAFFTTKFSDAQLKSIDKLSWIPLAFLVVGFIAAFFHLTQPLSAAGIFTGLGRSPMSNEILVASVFFVLAIVYCILGIAGKLTEGTRKAFSAILAVAGFVFAAFVGLAYMIETIPSWNTVFVPLQVVGFFLIGGGLIGTLVLFLAGALKEAKQTAFKAAMLVILALGFILGAVCLGMQVGLVAGLMTSSSVGSVIVADVLAYVIASVLLLALACVGGYIFLIKKDSKGLLILSCVLAVAAIFIARLVFYAMQVSVGL